jgi:hypothetical protein
MLLLCIYMYMLFLLFWEKLKIHVIKCLWIQSKQRNFANFHEIWLDPNTAKNQSDDIKTGI